MYFAKGAVEQILRRCVYYHHCLIQLNSVQSLINGDSRQSLDSAKRAQICDIASKMGSMGLRVLALAKGIDPNQMIFYGLIGLMDPPRPGVDKCIRILLDSGVRVIMITGDAKETACAIGWLSFYKL